MKRIIAVFLAAGLGVLSYAQNLNPTVRITNTYKSGQEDGNKQYADIALPDSLTRFDYHFDYSVFDTPYRGAFEFSPYSVNLRPEAGLPESGRFFLRAGAGYGLHPQLQAVWSPLRKERFNLNVHQDFHGYYGKYRTVRKNLSDYPMWTTTGERYLGYDFSELGGVDLRYSGRKSDVVFGVDYNGIFTNDEYAVNSFNSIVARLGVKSNKEAWDKLRYDASLTLDFATDALSHPFEDRNLDQGALDLAAALGPKLSDKFGILIDARLKAVKYRGADNFAYSYLGFAVAPHVALTLGPVDILAGVKLDGTSQVHFSPDVRASMKIWEDKIKLVASVTGGTIFNTYSETKRDWHWFCPGLAETMTNGWENLNCNFGLQGRISRFLQYKLDGGWASAGNLAMWGVRNVSGVLRPLLAYRDCNYAYANASLVWKSAHFDVDGNFRFRKSSLAGSADVFDMPVASGDCRVAYNWNRRIYAGVRMEAASPRGCTVSGVPMRLAGYVDLGVFGEFRINSKWSVWVEGGNLLNQTVQLVPMHVENGISGTAGISLHL